MTEIRVDVDLEHPPALVWRAFTEARLVTDWLPTTRFMARDDGTFTFQASDLAGLEDPIEGQLVTVEAPHRLVMRWQATDLHTIVAVTLAERGEGSRFTFTQSGFLGRQGIMRRTALLTTYTSLLEGPLPATLAKIAARAAEQPEAATPPAAPWRNAGGPFNRLPRQPNAPSRSAPALSSHLHSTAGPRPATPVPGFAAALLNTRETGVPKVAPPVDPAQRTARMGSLAARGGTAVRNGWRWLAGARDWSADQRSQAVAAGAAVLLLLAMAGILIGRATTPHPPTAPQTGRADPGPIQATVPAAPEQPTRGASRPVVPAASRSATPSPTPSLTPPSGPSSASSPDGTAGIAQLTGAYKTENLTLTSYRVTVTISNPSQTTANDWAVVIVLPLLDLTVRNVTGGAMTRSGLRLTFTAVDATRTIKPGGSATLRFDVEGLGVRNEPFTCTIGGQKCSGIPG
ncbi:SRPBCC domain-containing protein [Dactylosporangium sp. NPDC000555]|uniref:SRPBCC domain-containing protein n=1 Tax=Dactylosporangium sp. NPDC000555 TaxID=3154260 RepID=UPI00331E0811